MYAAKTNEANRLADEGAATPGQHSKPTFEFVDRRPEALIQRKLKEAIDASAQDSDIGHDPESIGAAPIQRKIENKGTEYPTTWKQIAKFSKEMQDAAEAVWNDITKLGNFDTDKLETAWNRVAKDNKKTFDIETQRPELIEAILNRYNRSMRSKGQYNQRKGEVEELIKPFMGEDTPFEYKPSARNPMLVSQEMQSAPFDSSMPGPQRLGRHISTMALSEYPKGQEVQSSVRHDGLGLFVSSNLNTINSNIKGQLSVARDLKDLAARLLGERGLQGMTREEAMNDRVTRHMLKLYDRISDYLASDAPLSVPGSIETDLDGRHAEIRIEQSEDWSADTHYTPTGTKYPCMGCYLYFAGKCIEVGQWYGPMWITNAALTTQLESLLTQQKNFGSFGSDSLREVSSSMFENYENLPEHSHMGMGITKEGETTIDVDADSESEFDEEEFIELQERVKARNEGVPMSPQWLESSMWTPEEEQKERPQIDVFNVHGTRYAVNDPRIRNGGECLWDTLRVYGFSDMVLQAAAINAGLTINEHVMLDQIPHLINLLGWLTGKTYGWVIDVFGIDGTPQGREVLEGSDGVLYIGMMVAPDAQGHYVPLWD